MPVITLCPDPRILLIPNFIDAEESAALRDLAAPRLQRSTVETGNDPNNRRQVSERRTSHNAVLNKGETERVRRIEERAGEAVGIPAAQSENIQVVRYGENEFYQNHFDWYDPANPLNNPLFTRHGQRIATMIVYLNQVEEGGGTYFPALNVRIKPKLGWAVFWDNCLPGSIEGDRRTLHRGEPVIKGEKWIANIWFRERPFFDQNATAQAKLHAEAKLPA